MEKKRLVDSIDELLRDYGTEVETVTTRNQYGDQVLRMACVKGSVYEAELIFSAGSDINAQGEDGYTPLHSAVEQSHDEIVKRCGRRKDFGTQTRALMTGEVHES